MLFAYDLDGTLVDTREANLAAYNHINVAPPHNFNQIHWSQWCDQEVHDYKNETLPSYKHLIKPLPLLEFAIANPGTVLSMCSKPAYNLIREVVPQIEKLKFRGILIELSSSKRLAALKLKHPQDNGFYFDDNAEFCKFATKIGWVTCHVTSP